MIYMYLPSILTIYIRTLPVMVSSFASFTFEMVHCDAFD